MLPLGTQMPEFTLPDTVSGKQISTHDFAKEKPLLVMFICEHCPYVIHLRKALAKFGTDYAEEKIGMIAISANDAEKYPDDAPEALAEMARELGFNFPFCYDETQEVAKAFTAACTPDFFLFDANRKLVYRGQFDSSRPGKGVANGEDLRAATDATLAGKPVNAEQTPSVGCNIKWK